MAVNTITQVYTPVFDVWSRPVTITPLVSQPGQPAYSNRGIYNSQPLDVMAEDDSILSDARTILDIIETEYAILPVQGDRVFIPAYESMPSPGEFEVIDSDSNAGGEITLTLRKIVMAKP